MRAGIKSEEDEVPAVARVVEDVTEGDVPNPRAPLKFAPKDFTVPPLITTIVNPFPQATHVAVVMPATKAKLVFATSTPDVFWPHSPYVFRPHTIKLPLANTMAE